jgi:NAD(P)H-hydrate epimerase
MDNYKEIEDLFDWPDCFIIGPGLSPCKESVELIEEILENFTGNCVLDASGFLSLSNFNEFGFSKLPQKTILTPHYGELSKILNISNNELRDNTIEILIDISKKLEDRILVLKGPNTIIINGNSEIRILSNGNQLLSTAGTGDVLTGMISAYVAAGYSLEESAIVASYIHAECSNFFLKEGHENISTSQIIDLIPKVQFRLRANYDT